MIFKLFSLKKFSTTNYYINGVQPPANKRTKYKTIFFALLLMAQFTYATAWGVTHPQPKDLQLKKGEEVNFWVAIDATQSDFDLKCDIKNFGNEKLDVTFYEEKEMIIQLPAMLGVGVEP